MKNFIYNNVMAQVLDGINQANLRGNRYNVDGLGAHTVEVDKVGNEYYLTFLKDSNKVTEYKTASLSEDSLSIELGKLYENDSEFKQYIDSIEAIMNKYSA